MKDIYEPDILRKPVVGPLMLWLFLLSSRREAQG
jgi:hypothetical protein